MARGRTRKKKGVELAGQADPKAPLDAAALLATAQPLLKRLREDLGARASSSPAVTAALEARHAEEKAARRTADGFAAWRERLLAQVAASWFLSCVFVRTLEDRGLLGRNRLAGPGATDSQSLFFSLAPSLTERDYLLFVFRELTRFPAARPLFDPAHCLVWKLAPSAEVARDLLGLFRQPSAEAPAFRFGQASTRFLGDLYQDLDEEVRKRYALLQTPDFIESFILDRTLEPAIEKFGLDDTTLIDPTCGSGHFLLGAFDRLFEHRLRAAPDLGERKAAELALAAVYGADINPYAVAIARFRLTLAYLDKAGFTRLADAPALPLHLVVADSLLHNPHRSQTDLEHRDEASVADWRTSSIFALEDEAAARDVLHRQYAAVLGNPPYINVKDGVLRGRYAEMYPSCTMNYALTVPFTERFFQLGRKGGFVGQITANSFMKREFGKKVIEGFLKSTNLEIVVNTSGAFIPGHGTPTVLLFGTADEPQGSEVLTVLAKRGEPSTPADPSKGEVWSSIASHWSEVGFENDYISVSRTARGRLARHPWSLGGGGATDLKQLLEERAAGRLSDVAEDIGFSIILGEDEVFVRPRDRAQWKGLPRIPIVIGEEVRDWALSYTQEILRPFDEETLEVTPNAELERELWPWRTLLRNRIVSGSTTMDQSGRRWFDVRRLSRDKHKTPFSIAFAEVATHNHFVLDRGGKVFNRTAPIVKLPATTTEDDHLALLAYLNSSTAAFAMRQVCQNKGGQGINEGLKSEAWEQFIQRSSTALSGIPVPPSVGELRALGRLALAVAGELAACHPLALAERARTGEELESLAVEAKRQSTRLLGQLVALQERIDWEVYRLFHLVPDVPDTPEVLEPGLRPFEWLLAREAPTTSWFSRNRYRSPSDVDPPPRAHLDILATVSEVRLLERPEFKHRWTVWEWSDEMTRARDALRLRQAETVARSTYEIVGARTFGDDLKFVVAGASVPFLACLRFTDSGMEKHALWQRAWLAQRAEDAGQTAAPSEIPPRYKSTDYSSTSDWQLRGKLDVPKEAFISYPGCESDEDHEPVYGWAGWNHLERARALGTLYYKRKTEEGWTAERLTPMLAGLLELLPWVKQWHAEPDPDYGGQRPGDYFEQFLDAQCQELGLTRADLINWRPEKRKPRQNRGKAAAAAKTGSRRVGRGASSAEAD